MILLSWSSFKVPKGFYRIPELERELERRLQRETNFEREIPRENSREDVQRAFI